MSLASTLRAGFFERGQLAYMGLLLMLIYLAWVEIALLLFMLFLGPQPMPPLEAFVPTLLLTPRGLGLLTVGTGVGMALAATSLSGLTRCCVPASAFDPKQTFTFQHAEWALDRISSRTR